MISDPLDVLNLVQPVPDEIRTARLRQSDRLHRNYVVLWLLEAKQKAVRLQLGRSLRSGPRPPFVQPVQTFSRQIHLIFRVLSRKYSGVS